MIVDLERASEAVINSDSLSPSGSPFKAFPGISSSIVAFFPFKYLLKCRDEPLQ